MLAIKITTTTGPVVARLLAGGNVSMFNGMLATNSYGTVYYVKLYWEGTGVAPPSIAGGAQPATTVPVAGTTVPSMTIAVPLTSATVLHNVRITNGGRLWYWISLLPADTDTTVLGTGGDQVSFLYE